ncbi:cysteine hydrolase family protein [Candidatus Kryptobacter tengchongensis]|uniref:nicotinamidase n=1 Tax=Kryptobacter tengchongensis TaxID=1643429 RepID=A0A656D8K5_KRYT1|nr:isochorismatase family cysteine hydrolase [Candidatus Kryptobacter tengchongensis]CUT02626.1 nicotinamidase/pyrazinamidase [Candidatus Kryptobacter tengchongensis]
MRKELIFWDVDTQYDFMLKDGNLYVPNAEEIIPNLEKLYNYARKNGIQIMGSADYHTLQDEEISENPDYLNTFPPHCLQNTPGWERIDATKPLNPLYIDSHPYSKDELKLMIQNHTGEIIFRKQKFDVFSNPNVDPVLDLINPKEIVVFGVALDVCDAYAIEGFLKRKKYKIYLVEDAVKPIYEDRGKQLIEKWRSEGVEIVKTDDIVEKNILLGKFVAEK